MINRVIVLGAVCVVAALVYPIFASGPQLDQAATALALAGPAAAAALSAAVGRPTLAAAALAGAGAYTSGLLARQGVPVVLSVLCGGGAGATAAALVALVCWRLEAPAFLVASLLAALGGGALVQALPAATGAEAGLGPIPPIEVALGTTKNAVATPVGDFHVLLAVAAVVAVVAGLGLLHGPGPVWRAIGSDRERATASGIRPLVGEIGALALGGLMAGLCGALAAHVSRVASPSAFGIDAAALPLLAALAAGRQPIAAAGIAVATGLVGQVVLPAAGWHGPPDAGSLALGLLAVATVATLLPTGAARDDRPVPGGPSPDDEWPLAALGIRGASVEVLPITVRSREGALLVAAPSFSVAAGQVLAIVGPNGSGKSTLLRRLATILGRERDASISVDGGNARCVLMPQEGGGFGFCTVRETLVIAGSHQRAASSSGPLADAWIDRLGLRDVAGAYCAELPAGRRRLAELGRVLLSAPSVLLCDEPLAGLDDGSRAAAVSCLRAASRAGLTILIAEHDREAVAALAGSVVTLERADLVGEPLTSPAT